MCRNNNKVYCTVGQSSHSVPFSPSRVKRAKDENRIAAVDAPRSTAITRSGRGRQSCIVPATEIGLRKPLANCGKGFPFWFLR